MKAWKVLVVAALLTGSLAVSLAPVAEAAALRFRQRYGGWSYYPTRTYYYRSYYYKPYNNYEGYKYHYCIYYPSRPQYVYYYNPYSKVYWGRYDLEAKGYSMLAEDDRKGNLDDISEDAFPKPGEMPAIPDSEDGEKIEAIGADDLPNKDTPEDVPGGEKP